MDITRLYTDVNGTSHFETYSMIMEESSSMGYHTQEEKNVNSFYYQNVNPHSEWDFHPVSKKVYLNILEGEIELEVSDGEKRRFKGGDVVLLDDHLGKGHKVRTFESVVCAAITLLK